MSVHEITDNNFQNEVLEEKKTVLIDFFADWCYPCKMMTPVVEEVSKEESIKVGKVNIDENQELAMKYEVMSIPTLIIYKNGKEAKRFVGVRDKKELLNEF